MNDQISTPAATDEEPIPLEPIALEPLEPGAVRGTTADHPALGAPATVVSSTSPLSGVDATTATMMPAIANPALVVVRGQRMDVKYPLFPGKNYLGRTDDKPVDIDLEDQEAQDRIWTSRQHAVCISDEGLYE